MKYFAFVACLLVSVSVWGQRYVLFNPSCTERFKYSTPYGDEHIIYAVQLSETERIFLEIGEEAKNYKPRISGALISCNNPSLNRNIVDQINGGLGTSFYMVRKEGKGKFLVSPILKASYFNYSDNSLEYAAKEYAFSHSLWDEARNNNLNTRSSSTQIFFVGTTNYDCRKGYTFSVSDRNGQLSDLTILPDVGVVNNAAFNSNLQLSTINATNFRDYLTAVCNGGAMTSDGMTGISQKDVDFEEDFQSKDAVYRQEPTRQPTTSTTSTPVYRAPTTNTPVYTNTTRTTNTPVYTNATRTTTTPVYTNTTRTSTPIYTNAGTTSAPIYRNTTPTRTYTPSVSQSTKILPSEFNTKKRLATDVSYGPAIRQTTTTTPVYTTTPRYTTTTPRYTAPTTTRVYQEPTPEVYTTRGSATTLPVYTTSTYKLPPIGAANKNYRKVNVRKTSGNTHTVRKRETAYSIAKAYGISLEQLGRCNNLQDFTLQPGQKLTISCSNETFVSRGTYTTTTTQPVRTTTNVISRPVTTTVTTTTTPSNRYGTPAWQSTSGEHVVGNGETISSISKLYGYTVARFLDLNGLSANTIIYAGQRLVTSDCSARPVTTTSTTNAVKTNYIGDSFQERGGSTVTPTSPAPYNYYQPQRTSYNTRGSQTHTVRERETLFSIARAYNTNIDQLKALNDMEIAETVIPGQIIFVR